MLIHAYMNKRYGMGLGDFIRGSLGCYQMCNIYKIPLAIDFRNHSVGQYLDLDVKFRQCMSSEIVDLQDIRKFTVSCLKHHLTIRQKNKDIKMLRRRDMYIYTNIWPRFPLAEREKEFAKSFLVPNAELQLSINSALPIREEYEIVHIRSGDQFAFDTQIGETFDRSTDQLLESLSVIESIKNSTHRKIIVMSDSLNLKRLLSSKYGLISLNTVPTHTALESKDEENLSNASKDLAIRDTLVDFFIMSQAKHIHQFSVQHWGSGFSNSINWIYDVPLTTYKI